MKRLTGEDNNRKVVSFTFQQNRQSKRQKHNFYHLQILPSLGYFVSDAAVVTNGQK